MSLDIRRLEELSLNSSAPPGQLLYDGWILRLLAGKAKRARSINPVYPSSLPLENKIAYCEKIYARTGLPAIFRITPFVQPADLDAELARRGYGVFDETAVESALLDPARFNGARVDPMPLPDWIEAVGDLRGSPKDQRQGQRARLEGCPLEMHAVGLRIDGKVVATGLTILEDGAAGLFDIVTDEAHRRAGHARTIVAGLLAHAWQRGARNAYLQVDAANHPARSLYRQFGFEERYRYWYRGRDGDRR